jgi:hypothetical protein
MVHLRLNLQRYRAHYVLLLWHAGMLNTVLLTFKG